MSGARPHVLTILESLHEEALAATSALAALVEGPPPQRAALSAARRRLGDAAAGLTRCLERQVYPELLGRLAAADADRVRALQDSAVGFRALASTYMTVWPTDRAIARWRQYRSASRAMRDRIRQRIEDEAALLYPLLASD